MKPLKTLVIGGGGREDALARRLLQSDMVKKVIVSPGNDGIARRAECVKLEGDEKIRDYAESQNFDWVVIGPEQPLAAGLADRLRDVGIPVFGPGRSGATLESSKAFAKDFMVNNGIPTAGYRVCHTVQECFDCWQSGDFQFPLVLKADGLAAGKGVFIAGNAQSAQEFCLQAISRRKFGSAGKIVVVEEFLTGDETSFIVITDGRQALPLPTSQDHKQVFDQDRGPNTGGMGAYSPTHLIDPQTDRQIIDRIVLPSLEGLKKSAIDYRGVLYFGLMLTTRGPLVLEINCRFGDPETQAILPLCGAGFVERMYECSIAELTSREVAIRPRYSTCVILASDGYPGEYETGRVIGGLDELEESDDLQIFHSGTRCSEGQWLTNGGRVLGITSQADRLEASIAGAYEAAARITFEGKHYRTDIGKRKAEK